MHYDGRDYNAIPAIARMGILTIYIIKTKNFFVNTPRAWPRPHPHSLFHLFQSPHLSPAHLYLLEVVLKLDNENSILATAF